jgi:hypothetical protein
MIPLPAAPKRQFVRLAAIRLDASGMNIKGSTHTTTHTHTCNALRIVSADVSLE